MNRKFALFIVIALLTSLVWVSSVLAAPETTMNVCVALEGSRILSTQFEPTISYELTKQSGGTVYAASSASTISGAPSTTGCFDVVAEPGEVYDVKVSGADTLTASVTGFTINDGVTIPITLREGDLNSDNNVNISDFTLFNSTWQTAGSDVIGDLNEEGNVNISDFTLFNSNWQTSGSRGNMSRSSVRGPIGAATIKIELLTPIAAPFAEYLVVVTNPGGHPIDGIPLTVEYDAGLTFVSVKNGAACAGTPLGSNCSMDGLAIPNNDAGNHVVDVSVTGVPNSAATQNAFVLSFISGAACDPATTCKMDIIGGDSAAGLEVRAIYHTTPAQMVGADLVEIFQFDNCNIGMVCGFANIGNRVWLENDGDGIASTGVITSAVGVTVTASSPGRATFTTTTDASGLYTLTVPTGDGTGVPYTMNVATPAGFQPSAIPVGAGDNENHGTGAVVNLSYRSDDTTDFAFFVSTTAIALSSNVAAPSQAVAAIVLVFVASALVIGSRFAILNKRK